MHLSSDCINSPGKKLSSKISDIPAYIRFKNFTSYYARIYWLDYEGERKLYNTLGPNDFLDVNTFVTHLWIFENNETGDRLMGESSFVFSPQSWLKTNEQASKIDPRYQSSEVAVRKIIPITYPLYTLKMRALQAVRDFIFIIEDIKNLELPLSLKTELQLLLKRKHCTLSHELNCNKCSKVKNTDTKETYSCRSGISIIKNRV